MKKFILILIMSFLSFVSNAQDTYPHFLVENGKQTVVFTLEQAQKIDNDQQLLTQFRQLGADMNLVDSACVKVVDTQGKEITGLKTEISGLKSLGLIKDKDIVNLKVQIAEYVKKEELSKTELVDKDKIIVEKDSQIKKQRNQKIIAFIGTATIAILYVFSVLHR